MQLGYSPNHRCIVCLRRSLECSRTQGSANAIFVTSSACDNTCRIFAVCINQILKGTWICRSMTQVTAGNTCMIMLLRDDLSAGEAVKG